MGFGREDPQTGAPIIYDSLLQGGIVSVYYLGTLCGALLGGWFGDKYGRIKAIGFGAVWAILGASLQGSAQNHEWMICARTINGIGTGILNAIVPVYATETAEHTSRGQFVAIEFTLNIFGRAFLPSNQDLLLTDFQVLLSLTGSNSAPASTRTVQQTSHGDFPFSSNSSCLSCSSSFAGPFPNPPDTSPKSDVATKLDTSSESFVGKLVKMRAGRKPSTKTFAILSNWKEIRPRLSHTIRCSSESTVASYTPVEGCSWSSGFRSGKNGSVSECMCALIS